MPLPSSLRVFVHARQIPGTTLRAPTTICRMDKGDPEHEVFGMTGKMAMGHGRPRAKRMLQDHPERIYIADHPFSRAAASPPPSSWPASTPTPSGTSIGSTGRTCPLLKSAPSTPTRTFAPATSPGAMVTRYDAPATSLFMLHVLTIASDHLVRIPTHAVRCPGG